MHPINLCLTEFAIRPNAFQQFNFSSLPTHVLLIIPFRANEQHTAIITTLRILEEDDHK